MARMQVETVFNLPEGTVMFTKHPCVRYSLGPARPHPTDPMKAVASLIVEYELPDPSYCAVITNIGEFDAKIP